MKKGFLLYEESANISPYMRRPLVILCYFLSVQAGRETGGICFAQISTFSPTKMMNLLFYCTVPERAALQD
jgi:hypothetical protein